MIATVATAPSDPFTPNYGCFVADFGCQASQTVAQFMGSTIKNLGDFIATMIAGSFNTNIDQGSWNIAHSQFLFWIAVTAPVILIVALVQIGIAMILQDWGRIGRTAAGAALAIPFSAICVWGMQKASGITDDITRALTTAVQGGDLSQSLLRVVGLFDAPKQIYGAVMKTMQFSQDGVIWGMATQGAQGPGSVGEYVMALLIVGLMMIASLFLFIAMSIREFGLLALAAMAPVGLMMIGQPKLTAWAQRWLNLSVGLLIAKPLAAGVVLLAVELDQGQPQYRRHPRRRRGGDRRVVQPVVGDEARLVRRCRSRHRPPPPVLRPRPVLAREHRRRTRPHRGTSRQGWGDNS
ncbi:hypothetical protein ACRAWC_21845 [Leifsonia sp. L25]|uniref:hypothetical protein n=1 Tax=Leifsonia sp. L25 TaxID=3423957 RepID=UPI003D699BF5